MAVTSTSIFQHANVEALMVTGSQPRFEILVDGIVTQSAPATKAWRAEKVAAINAARAIAGLPAEDAPVAVEVRMADKLHTVVSSAIRQLGYSAKRQELTVVFASGQAFVYRTVSLAEFNRLRCAKSVGKAFHAIVRGHKAALPVAA